MDVKETKDLYGRLMVVARSSRDINHKEAIGNHEFTVTPRALFASDGTILPGLDKSMLIHRLNKLATAENPQEDQQPDDRMDITPGCLGITAKPIGCTDGFLLPRQTSQC